MGYSREKLRANVQLLFHTLAMICVNDSAMLSIYTARPKAFFSSQQRQPPDDGGQSQLGLEELCRSEILHAFACTDGKCDKRTLDGLVDKKIAKSDVF